MKKNFFLCSIICSFLNLNLKAQPDSDLTPDIQSNHVFGEKEEHINNFTGTIYYIPENTKKLPDFSKLTPVGKIYTNSLNIDKQDFQEGFPGVSDRYEYFAIDYKGEFYLKDSGAYCFTLGSDDGSKLLIDDSLIINSDYLHELVYFYRCIWLTKGLHKIEVQYFQGPRFSVALVLLYRKWENKSYEVFNLSQFYPISVNEKEGSIDISIGNEILFDFNSFELSELARKALEEIKRVIIDKTRLESIIIEGHTDDIGSEEYNMKLSENRANAVKNYFKNIGVDSQSIITKGCGKLKPKVPNIDEDSRKKNRRIEMSVIKMK
jgi:outer membrane protein OmpA-like peptidoglycan-associated protein